MLGAGDGAGSAGPISNSAAAGTDRVEGGSGVDPRKDLRQSRIWIELERVS